MFPALLFFNFFIIKNTFVFLFISLPRFGCKRAKSGRSLWLECSFFHIFSNSEIPSMSFSSSIIVFLFLLLRLPVFRSDLSSYPFPTNRNNTAYQSYHGKQKKTFLHSNRFLLFPSPFISFSSLKNDENQQVSFIPDSSSSSSYFFSNFSSN